jgi:hypothetical protein
LRFGLRGCDIQSGLYSQKSEKKPMLKTMLRSRGVASTSRLDAI